jgi:DNA-binding IclR family transcriptional regulator
VLLHEQEAVFTHIQSIGEKRTMVQSETTRKQFEKEGGVQVIARAAEILRSLKGHPEGLSLSQISKEVGLARSTVHRIVNALATEDFVTSASPNGRIRLGLGLTPLAAWVNSELRYQLRPYLERLSREVNETVDLAVLDRDQVFFIDQVSVPQRLQAVSGVGATFPAYCTANGKALLAELSTEQVERLLPEQLHAFTPSTFVTRTQLLEELKRIRSEQVAFDREEYTLGICAIGKTVRDTTGNLVAITIPVPSIRFYGNEQRLSSVLFHTCEEIQRRFEALL